MSADKWARARRRAQARAEGAISLWDEPRDVGLTDSAESWEAAKPTNRKIASRSIHRAEVLDVIRGAGNHGVTDDELKATLHWRHPGGTSKRRLDLVRAGLVKDSGKRRPSKYGAMQAVWVAS